jgi:hypothetical protein
VLVKILRENNGKPKAGTPSARFEESRQKGQSAPSIRLLPESQMTIHWARALFSARKQRDRESIE